MLWFTSTRLPSGSTNVASPPLSAMYSVYLPLRGARADLGPRRRRAYRSGIGRPVSARRVERLRRASLGQAGRRPVGRPCRRCRTVQSRFPSARRLATVTHCANRAIIAPAPAALREPAPSAGDRATLGKNLLAPREPRNVAGADDATRGAPACLLRVAAVCRRAAVLGVESAKTAALARRIRSFP